MTDDKRISPLTSEQIEETPRSRVGCTGSHQRTFNSECKNRARRFPYESLDIAPGFSLASNLKISLSAITTLFAKISLFSLPRTKIDGPRDDSVPSEAGLPSLSLTRTQKVPRWIAGGSIHSFHAFKITSQYRSIVILHATCPFR